MAGVQVAPHGVERRSFKVVTPLSLVTALRDASVQTGERSGCFSKVSPGRQFIVKLLERQIAASHEKQYPLSVAVIRLQMGASLHAYYRESVISAVSKIFTGQLRPTDMLVRLSDDTLVLALPGATTNGARQVARRLQAQIERSLHFGRHAVKVTAAFGVSSEQEGSTGTGNSLLTAAECALESAVAEEPGGFVVYEAVPRGLL